MHEHPEDLNPEAAIHFEGRPPKTAGKTKRQNAIVAVRNHLPPPPRRRGICESFRRLKADGCVFARRR